MSQSRLLLDHALVIHDSASNQLGLGKIRVLQASTKIEERAVADEEEFVHLYSMIVFLWLTILLCSEAHGNSSSGSNPMFQWRGIGS